MISLYVETTTGHYRVPGNVSNLCEAPVFPIAPPSTVRGFIESLCGRERGWFEGEVAYGWLEEPLGQGTLLRTNHAWSSSGAVSKTNPHGNKTGSMTRPIHVSKVFRPRYHICIRASEEQEAVIREALKGNVPRSGVLSLGESDDMVSWMREVNMDAPTKWVVEGGDMPLTTHTDRGYHRHNPTTQQFQFGDKPYWISYQPPGLFSEWGKS